jgi:hypothetical protein
MKITLKQALSLLKSGNQLGNRVISDLATSKVKAMDAILLAEHGIAVPDSNIVYDDSDIQYDPDFDEMEWGKPFPFRKRGSNWRSFRRGS